ncbi:MAG: site-specific integrase [Bacilli bacterium]|nr:site-specific integrase [Bacilli bacterium]
MSFEKAYEEYLKYASNQHKKQGFDTITKNFKLHILPYFNNKDITKLSKLDIIKWQNEILELNFSNNFNRNLYYEFSAFFRYCINCDYLSENIILQVPKFKKKIEIKEHQVYNIWQFRWFRFHLKNFVIKQYFNFMFFNGPRPSEAMALKFTELDGFKIHIRHSLQRKGKRELDTPKNQSSVRIIKISLLMRIRIWLLKRYYLKKYGNFSNDYFIFGGTKPLAPTTIDRYKKNACIKANLKPITQHEFRHSYATRMIHKKIPIDVVSKSMGHSTISMTVDVYLH